MQQIQQAEEAWAAKLQVHAWSTGCTERRSVTESGVLVVRRPKKRSSSVNALCSGGLRASC